MTLVLKRSPVLNGCVFGSLSIDNLDFACYTLENPAYLIPPGTYTLTLDKSPHLGYVCPHLQVPLRDEAAGGDAGLRLHIANLVTQLLGCIALGLQIDGNALDHSEEAFHNLMSLLVLPAVISIS